MLIDKEILDYKMKNYEIKDLTIEVDGLDNDYLVASALQYPCLVVIQE